MSEINELAKALNENHCAICNQLAVTKYENEPSCGRPTCEFQIQEGLDYIQDRRLGE